MKKDIIKKLFFLLFLIGVVIEMSSQNNKEKDSLIGGLGNPCPAGVDCEGDFFNPRLVTKKKVDISVNEVEKATEKVASKKKLIAEESKILEKDRKTIKPLEKEKVLFVKKAPIKSKKPVKKEVVEAGKKKKLEGPPDGWDAPPTGLGFDEFRILNNSINNYYVLPVNNSGAYNSGNGSYRASYSR